MLKADVPYNDLPLLPPDKDIESKTILKKAITANKAITELKNKADFLPNQSILLSTIALREAKDRGIAISRENMTDIEASTADTGNLLPMVSLMDCPDIFSPQSPLEKEERKLKYLLAVFSDKPELSLYATISSSPASSERIYAELSPSAKEEKMNTAKETAMSVIINDNPLTAICFTC